MTFEEKVQVLETVDVTERLALAVKLQRARLTELQVRKRIREDVQSGADQQQRGSRLIANGDGRSIQREGWAGRTSANVVGGSAAPRDPKRQGMSGTCASEASFKASAASGAWARQSELERA